MEEVDTVARAPPFLFPNAWLAQRQGWLLQSPPQVALVHLLGVRCRWCLRSDDTDHGAKWEWWHYPLFLLAGAVLKMAWRRVHGQPVAVPRGTKKL